MGHHRQRSNPTRHRRDRSPLARGTLAAPALQSNRPNQTKIKRKQSKPSSPFPLQIEYQREKYLQNSNTKSPPNSETPETVQGASPSSSQTPDDPNAHPLRWLTLEWLLLQKPAAEAVYRTVFGGVSGPIRRERPIQKRVWSETQSFGAGEKCQ